MSKYTLLEEQYPFFDSCSHKSLQKMLRISPFCQDFDFLKSKIS